MVPVFSDDRVLAEDIEQARQLLNQQKLATQLPLMFGEALADTYDAPRGNINGMKQGAILLGILSCFRAA